MHGLNFKHLSFTCQVKMFFIAMFVIVSSGAEAQQSTRLSPKSITGKVTFADDELPVENATVQLLNEKDSTVVASTATAKEGLFRLNDVKPEDYILKISFISFENSYHNIKRQHFSRKEIALPTVHLEEKSILLSEAVVVGQMPEIIVKEDTLEYNPAAFKLQGNAVVEDLLKRLPGVEVDMDGKITVAGKTIRRVMVDGENFFGNDPTMTTKNLEIDIIDKLQIIEKKSDLEELTGIDDGERETIINLTIKKDRKKGWVNNIEAGLGNLDRKSVV